MRRRFTLTGLALLAVLAASGCAPGERGVGDEGAVVHPALTSHGGDINFQAAIERAKARVFPTLVYVKPIREDYSEGKKKRVVVSGSGVIISPDGYVVTNHHVAEKAVEIRCVLYDNRMLEADLIGTDKDTDLALLKLRPEGVEESEAELPADAELVEVADPVTLGAPEPAGANDAGEPVRSDEWRPSGSEVGDSAEKAVREPSFSYATLADSDEVEEGQFVMALGSPWGLKRSISLGIVSSAQRFLDGSSMYSLWIQCDAALNPGNSGGPLINTEGEVIAINTLASMRGGDMGFGIPSNTVRQVVEEIKAHGSVRRAWTGIRLQPLRDFDRDAFFDGDRGVLVASVDPGSPAETAGLASGDLVLSINGQPVDGLYNENLPEVRRVLADLPEGEPATFAIRREGEPVTAALTPREKGMVEGEDLELKRWNMTLKSINEHETPMLHYYCNEGVYVQGVSYRGNARLAGLGGNEIILKIGDKPTKTLADAKDAYDAVLADQDRPKKVILEVMEQGISRLVVLDYSVEWEKE